MSQIIPLTWKVDLVIDDEKEKELECKMNHMSLQVKLETKFLEQKDVTSKIYINGKGSNFRVGIEHK